MKKLVLFITAATLALLLCSCGAASEPIQADSLSVSPVPPPSGNPTATVPQSDTSAQTPPPDSVIEWPDETVSIAGLYSFGMTYDEIMEILFANGFDGVFIEAYRHYSALDNGLHEDYNVGAAAFTFDASGRLYDFRTSELSTARGFVPQDDVSKMIKLYGNAYKKLDDETFGDVYFCEYSFDEYHLVFYVNRDTDIIGKWGVSRYSMEDKMAASD